MRYLITILLLWQFAACNRPAQDRGSNKSASSTDSTTLAGFVVSDSSFASFLHKFVPVNRPLNLSRDCLPNLQNASKIDETTILQFVHPRGDTAEIDEGWEGRDTRYGQLVACSAEFVAVTHGEWAAVDNYTGTLFLTTYSRQGKILSRIVAAEIYEGTFDSETITSLIDADLHIDRETFVLHVPDSEVEDSTTFTSQPGSSNVWREKFVIDSLGFIKKL